MAKVNLNDHRDNVFLEHFFAIEDEVNNTDLTKLTDSELQELFDKIAATKEFFDGLQLTVKQLANSIYGACGSEFFRFYNPELAGDITTEGKMAMFVVDETVNRYFKNWESDPEILQELQSAFPDKEFNIRNVPENIDLCVYGDTDSRYVDFGTIMKYAGYKPKTPKEACDFVVFMDEHRMAKKIEEDLYEYIKVRNGEQGFLIMELETIGGKAIYLVKKKYIMSLFWKDGKLVASQGKLKATGVEINQGSTSQFVKKHIKAVLNKLLTPGFKMTDIFKLGIVIVQRAMAAPIDELLLSTGIGAYKDWVSNDKDEIVFIKTGAQAHIRAAAEYNHYLYENNLLSTFPKYIGGKIHWYYAKSDAGVFGVPDGVSVAELPGAPEMDYEKQVDKLIITPIKRYLFNTEIDKSAFGQKEVLFSFGKLKKV